MSHQSDPKIQPSEITPETIYRDRRKFMAGLAGIGLVAAAAPAEAGLFDFASSKPAKDTPTSYQDITHYNNFYEFGTGKTDPFRFAGKLRTSPWQIEVGGLVRHPGHFDMDAIHHQFPSEERIYRMRCVEGWSMVIPWDGFSLAKLLNKVEPLPQAKYVEFITLMDPRQMPGQTYPVLNWPYREGLRLDEAMHPLTILATGIYGKPLPNQDGAPIRLVVPWKYGFKGIKSIVKINLTDKMPHTSWAEAVPDEYGFYANVNPKVDHPRWSQATERRIGEWQRRPTLMFNGYADQVAHLYTGMDLRRYF